MPDALDAGWQNVQQEAANEPSAGQSDCAFAPASLARTVRSMRSSKAP